MKNPTLFNPIGKNTRFTIRKYGKELLIETRYTPHGRIRVTGFLRVSAARGISGMTELALTLHHTNGEDEIMRKLTRDELALMFNISGYGYHSNDKLAEKFGVTYANEGNFLRDGLEVVFPVPSQGIKGEPQFSFTLSDKISYAVERYIRSGNFR